jgi:tetratricopeptide (TPR) repeat protein
MQKHRVILIIIALVLITVLYFLPRFVVDNEKDRSLELASDTEIPVDGNSRNDSENIDVHSRDITTEDQNKITNLHEEMISDGSNQLIIADSLAQIFLTYDQFDSAAKYLDIIAEINPGLKEYENAGNAYYDALGFALDKVKANAYSEKAGYYYNLILKENPERLDIKNNLAMTYISTSNPMQGITMLREILEDDPENEKAIYNLGILAIQSGQYERAGERFKNLVSLYPQNLQGQFYLGLCYYELGQKDKARKRFELVKSMEDDPAVLATIDGYLKELN